MAIAKGMFMTRIFLAALFGGIAMFIWTSIAHMALPLGEASIREIPNQAAVLDAMQSSIGNQSSLYIFPGFGLGPNPTHEERSEAMKHMGENLARYPSGILMYHPAGSRPLMMVRWLSVEFATELVEALLVVFLLAQTRLTSFGARVGFVVAGGVLAAIATNIFLLELVRLPGGLHRRLHLHTSHRVSLRWSGGWAGLEESQIRSRALILNVG